MSTISPGARAAAPPSQTPWLMALLPLSSSFLLGNKRTNTKQTIELKLDGMEGSRVVHVSEVPTAETSQPANTEKRL